MVANRMDELPSQGHLLRDDGGLELWAPTEAALFGEAARAVVDRIAPAQPPGRADRRYLQVPGHGEARLRAWLDAVLDAAAQGFLYRGAEVELSDAGAAALVSGEQVAPRPAADRVAAVELINHPHGAWARVDLAPVAGETLALPQPYQELEHTADLAVQVRGASAEETLARLVCVLGRLLAGSDALEVETRVRVVVPAGDLPLAAVDVLRDLLYRFATERLVPAACRTVRLAPQVEVEVGLATWDPDEHAGADIKAITLHQLRFEPDGDGWLAQVVFDV